MRGDPNVQLETDMIAHLDVHAESDTDDDDTTKGVEFSDVEEERVNDEDDGFVNASIGVAEALLNEQMRKMTEGVTLDHEVEGMTNDPDYDLNHVMEAGYESEVLVSGDVMAVVTREGIVEDKEIINNFILR